MAESLQCAGACRNCDAPVQGNYWPNCGQGTSLHPLSVVEFVRELLSHYVAVEGKLWRTLALLVFRPGRLTVEYLAGRRQRYIIPIRLYLTASFLFFAVAQLNGHFMQAGLAGDGTVAPVFVVDPGDLEGIKSGRFGDCSQPAAHCSRLKRWLAPAMIKMQQDPRGFVQYFAQRFRHSVSFAMFLLLPVFAVELALAYRNRRMFYGEHLVFALHVHSFWFLIALVALWVPEPVGNWLLLACIAYGLWALHRVYGGRWRMTFLRGGVIVAAYLVAVGLGAVLLSAVLLSTS